MNIIEKLLEKKRYKQLVKFQDEFLKSYSQKEPNISDKQWLTKELIHHLPDHDPLELEKTATEIVTTIELAETKKKSAREKYNNGQSFENIIGQDIKNSLEVGTTRPLNDQLEEIGKIIEQNNQQMQQTLLTQTGEISQNPNLNGYIAEQNHVNTFNKNAALNGSDVRAEVLTPKPGQTYGKNSVDIVVRASDGIVQRYQLKYGKTAEETIKLIKKGNYNNQRIVVPPEQVEEVQAAFPNKTVSSTISYEGTSSDPLTKEEAVEIQNDAQENGNLPKEDWTNLSGRKLTKIVGKQAVTSAVLGAATTTAMEVGIKFVQGEDIEAEEVARKAIMTGADAGIKTATAGALKVCAEKGIISSLKGASGNVVSGIAFSAVESAKTMYKVGKGDLTLKEGMDEIEATTAGVVGSIAGSSQGTSIGAAIGTVLGSVGTAVGGVVGGIVGGIAGSTVGRTIAKGCQKVRSKVAKTFTKAAAGVKKLANKVSLLGIFS